VRQFAAEAFLHDHHLLDGRFNAPLPKARVYSWSIDIAAIPINHGIPDWDRAAMNINAVGN
jgi:hypothetical protein